MQSVILVDQVNQAEMEILDQSVHLVSLEKGAPMACPVCQVLKDTEDQLVLRDRREILELPVIMVTPVLRDHPDQLV